MTAHRFREAGFRTGHSGFLTSVARIGCSLLVVAWAVGQPTPAQAQRRGVAVGAIMGIMAGAIIAHQAAQARPWSAYRTRSGARAAPSRARTARVKPARTEPARTGAASDPFAGVAPTSVIEVRKD